MLLAVFPLPDTLFPRFARLLKILLARFFPGRQSEVREELESHARDYPLGIRMAAVASPNGRGQAPASSKDGTGAKMGEVQVSLG